MTDTLRYLIGDASHELGQAVTEEEEKEGQCAHMRKRELEGEADLHMFDATMQRDVRLLCDRLALGGTMEPEDGRALAVFIEELAEALDNVRAWTRDEVVRQQDAYNLTLPPDPDDEAKSPAQRDMEQNPASWVIRERATGKVLGETFDEHYAAAINRERFDVVPIITHLQSLNDPAPVATDPAPGAPVVRKRKRPAAPAVTIPPKRKRK